jgi:hypothetical protein
MEASSRNRLATIQSCHAVHFEKTDELTQSILSFITSIS